MKPHKPEHADLGAFQSLNPFASAWNGSAAGAIEKSAAFFGKSMRALQQESIRFMTRRIEDNLKAAEQFGACRNVPDFLAAQQKWFADMTHAYSQEWARCSEIMAEAAHEDGGQAPAEPSGHRHHAH